MGYGEPVAVRVVGVVDGAGGGSGGGELVRRVVGVGLGAGGELVAVGVVGVAGGATGFGGRLGELVGGVVAVDGGGGGAGWWSLLEVSGYRRGRSRRTVLVVAPVQLVVAGQDFGEPVGWVVGVAGGVRGAGARSDFGGEVAGLVVADRV